MQGREIEERENLLNIQHHTIVSGLALNVNVKKNELQVLNRAHCQKESWGAGNLSFGGYLHPQIFICFCRPNVKRPKNSLR